MDVDSETVPLRPCKTCCVGVLSAYDPVRFKNCARCRAQNRTPTSREAKQKSANYEVNAKQAAARKAFGNFGRRKGGSSEDREKISKCSPRVEVFPSTSDMYDALTAKVLGSYFSSHNLLEFHGTVYNVNTIENVNEDRVSMITIELADCAHLQFDESVFSFFLLHNGRNLCPFQGVHIGH